VAWFRMKIRPLLVAALLVAPGVLFAQAPPVAPAQASPASAKEKAKSDAKAPSAAEVDSAVIEVLRKSFAAQRAKGSYRALMDNSLGGNVLPSLELEAVYPNRIRLKRSGMEIIFVDGHGMVRKGDKWSAAPASLAKSLGAIDDPQEDEKLLGTAIFAKSLGATKIDDRILAGYEVHTKGKNGVTKSKFFISLDDSLIRCVETKSEFQGQPLFSKMMVGDYGIPIQIELPK
jgi:hypothetical protein